MSSSIFFRFKSQKEPVQITFDGTSLSVFEVKRDIITLSKLGDGTDFDLEIYTADSNEKYDDDTTQVPRSTTVIARRLPAARPGYGRAARYVTGKMPVNAKNAHRTESTPLGGSSKNTPTPMMNGAFNSGKEMTEEEKLQAMLSANDQNWKAEQESMSHKPVPRSFPKQTVVPDKPLPPGYICHRCGEKGHWIQACPTNNDPNFNNRPKFKRTTGIPRSFLKTVERPTEVGEDGKIDVSKLPRGVMYTANGELVIAEEDNATWQKIQEKQNAAAEKAKEVASDAQELRDRGLECELHNGVFVDPVKTPCCEKTYCRDCIDTALVEKDLLCPNCGQQVLLDSLATDDEMAAKAKAYEDEKKAEKKRKEQEAGKSPAAGTPQADSPKQENVQSPNGTAVPEVKVEGAASAASTPTSKKRAAEDDLQNDRRPSNPANSNSKQGTPQPNQSKQPPTAPAADIAEFQKQMQAMASSMAGMQNGMPAMMNPMMQGFNPAMMGMPGMPGMNMNMPMNPGMMGMPGMNMPPFPNVNGGMNGMNGMNGWNGPMMGGQGNWQGNGAGRGGMQNGGNGGGNDGAYMRQPVNPNRQRGRFSRPRSQDYRQV